jgi:2-oxoglutarate ferredoxin oxidoreductase subunit alpha
VRPAEVIAVPIEEIARRSAGTDKAKTTVVLGLLAGWFGLARQALLNGIRLKLARKGPEVVAANERAFAEGLAFAEAHPLAAARPLQRPEFGAQRKMLADGNEMCAARRRSCSSSPARSGATAGRCSRRRTRSPGSARRSAPPSPGRRP